MWHWEGEVDINTDSSGTIRVLCVDDDADTRELMQAMIKAYGYEPVIPGSVCDALEQVDRGGFALYVLDGRFGKSAGVDLCERIRASDDSTPIMFYSAMGYQTDIKRGMDAGAQAYVVKPNFEALERTIGRLIRP
jgi:DNA-binding response OmpR family regulator